MGHCEQRFLSNHEVSWTLMLMLNFSDFKINQELKNQRKERKIYVLNWVI